LLLLLLALDALEALEPAALFVPFAEVVFFENRRLFATGSCNR
jgi:hypothetical protein